ncbi:MAG TPA: DUF3182 family protein [Roseateles sp.]|nr:DUF3182 family protein [Roseateles sp.]
MLTSLATPSVRSLHGPGLLAALRGPPVAFYRCDGGARPPSHDQRSKAVVAEWLAELLDREFAGSVGPGDPATLQPLYLVPDDTLCDPAEVRRLGIRGIGQLFGGVAPWPFVATKVITHPLVRQSALAPTGWAPELGAALQPATLPGFSVFTPEDARLAARRLLPAGPLRLKSALGVGGAGQSVVRDLDEFEARLAAIDPALLLRHGWVLERNLETVTTLSVGRVNVLGRWVASYIGTQRLTRNHRDHEVYGGSSLDLVRGDFDALLRLPLPFEVRLAVRQAIAYHKATHAAFPGLFASRVNYDIAQGTDARGIRLSGVLEQSWRIGGASGAEVAALLAFKAAPALQRVQASTHEIYHRGEHVPPTGSRLLYDGSDPQAGRLTKYAEVLHDVYA